MLPYRDSPCPIGLKENLVNYSPIGSAMGGVLQIHNPTRASSSPKRLGARPRYT